MSKRNPLLYYKLVVLFLLLLCTHDLTAQAPALLNYQGVARNAAGVPLLNQNLSLRVNIRVGSATGQIVYSETRATKTNNYGLFSVQIGSTGASSYTNTLASVDWNQGSMFMELELDPDGGSAFVNLGTTQLLSVPYALSALTAAPVGNAGGDLSGTYPNPTIADKSILTSKLGDLSVTDSKIAAVSGSKVTGDISGNAGNVTGIVAIANGGTGAATAAQARINLGVDLASLDSIRVKLNATDTAAMLLPYRRTSNKIQSNDLATPYLPLTGGNVSGLVNGTRIRLTDSLTAVTIAKTGGTASQYLMADGSVSTLGDSSIADSKIAGISGRKVTGDIRGNANNVNGLVSVANGGTGATTAAQARINLGIVNFPSDTLRFKLNTADTAAMLLPYRRSSSKIQSNDLATPYLPLTGGNVSGLVNGTRIRLTDSITAVTIAKTGGTSSQYLMADGSVSTLGDLSITDSKIAGISASKITGDINGKSVNVTGIVDIANGGTGASNANQALINLGVKSFLSDSLRFKLNITDTSAMLLPYRRTSTKIQSADLATAYLPQAGGSLSGAVNGTTIKVSDTLAATTIIKTGGTASQYLMADGSISVGPPPVREVADEFTATAAQSVFTLSQSPGVNSKVKMYINGIRISNTAYTISGAVLTYVPANNGSYVLSVNDRIQFDYHY